MDLLETSLLIKRAAPPVETAGTEGAIRVNSSLGEHTAESAHLVRTQPLTAVSAQEALNTGAVCQELDLFRCSLNLVTVLLRSASVRWLR